MDVACDDGIDNDGDLLPDSANDPDCASPIDEDEAGPQIVPGLSGWAITVLVSLLSACALRSGVLFRPARAASAARRRQSSF
jgi:hypothetical protein